MAKFFGEFKKFITRGNVVDMSVGVIVGGAFTAIVNGMSNFILKPITNWLIALLIGKDSLSEMHTFLKRVDTTVEVLDESGAVIGSEVVPDLTQSIYIDWGSFINAIINFFLIAFVLFTIVKIINKLREEHDEFTAKVLDGKLNRAQRKEVRAHGIKVRDKAAVKAYFAEKKRLADEEAEKKAAEAAAAAKLERLANPTTEDLLKNILVEMQDKPSSRRYTRRKSLRR